MILNVKIDGTMSFKQNVCYLELYFTKTAKVGNDSKKVFIKSSKTRSGERVEDLRNGMTVKVMRFDY